MTRLTALQLNGWTLTLARFPNDLRLALTRPHTPDPHRWGEPDPALLLTTSYHLDDVHDDHPPIHIRCSPLPSRLWNRWMRRHPLAAENRSPTARTVGPWRISLTRHHGLSLQRLPEHDCARHLSDDQDCYPDDWYTEPWNPTPEQDQDAAPPCSCPRYRPYLHIALHRPERHPLPVEPPY